MRRRVLTMLGALTVAVGTPIALSGGAPAHALTCGTNGQPISYACNTVFRAVGTVCNASTKFDPCPPLG